VTDARTDEDPARGTRYYRGLTHAAVRRPVGTLALASVILVLGSFFIDRLPVNLLPEIEYPMITITVNYPGVAPEVMEEQVTRVLERNLSATEGLTEISSRASEGRTNVNLLFEFGIDLDIAMQNAARLLETARQQLPPDIDPPRLRKRDPGEWPVWRAGLSSPTRSPLEVRDWVDQRLLPQLQSIDGIATVEAIGGQIREVEIVLDQERLRSYGLTLSQVADQLARENVNIAAGNVTSPQFDVMARTDGRFRTPDDFARVLINIPGSDQRIRLSEVAEVRDGYREQRVFVRLNGVPATQLTVYKLPGANTIAVVDEIEATMTRLTRSGFIPEDVRWQTTQDGAAFIRGSLAAVTAAAVTGAVLSMLVVLCFLGSLRKSAIIGLAIPFAILTTFVLMGWGGLTLNVISLGGLALGVGLLLDNAIVMLENISRHQSRPGNDPETAAHEGADEVISAITAGTLTNLAAVAPFLLVTGFAALVFRELILTISFAVMASLVVALTLVPMLAAQAGRVRFRSGLSDSRAYRIFDAGIQRLVSAYRGTLRGLLRWRWAVIGGIAALFVGSLTLIDHLGNEFLPQLDDGQISVRGMLPPGTPPEETNRVSTAIEQTLAELPHVASLFSTSGGHFFGGVVSERPGRLSIDVALDPASARPDWPAWRWVVEAQRRLDSLDLAGARLFVRPPGIPGLTFGTGGTDMEVLLVGDELDELDHYARDLVDRFRAIPGLEDLELAREERTPLLGIDVDREQAASLGLNLGDVARAVRNAVTGAIPTRYQAGSAEYDVRVRLPRAATGDPDQLGALIVGRTAGGAPVQLRQVATFHLGQGPAHIERQNQVRVQRITGNFNTMLSDPGSILRAIEAMVADADLPSRYSVIYGGQFETMSETNRQMTFSVFLALFLVFVVLAVQYERLSNPVVILMTAPLSVIGVVGMLWVTGTPLSAPAMLGVILLVGIVVNNAILLVEYVERGRRRGLDLVDAVVEAGGIRLRPILMTTLTTVMGMLPLAIGMGAGANLMQPLAIGVIGGLLTATVLTLILVPCLYVMVHHAGAQLREWLLGPRPTRIKSFD
jgi:hydrophobe/amphiphile efflux-1 (HAE1) family protein